MKMKCKLLTFLLAYFIPHVYMFSFSNFELRDLESNTDTFIDEAALWNATNIANPPIYSVCGGTYLLGGVSKLGNSSSQMDHYFKRIYENLPSHTMVRYTLDFWGLGSWRQPNVDDYFQIAFDLQIIDKWAVDASTFFEDLCGGSTNDFKDFRIFGIIGHSSLTLDLRIISKLTHSSNRLLGVREISLLFDTGPLKSNYYCGRAPIPIIYNECDCIEGKYHNGSSSSCDDCHPACSSCFGPESDNCFACSELDTFDGNHCHIICQNITAEYSSLTDNGHQYKLYTFPNFCSVNVGNQIFQLIETSPDPLPNFTFTVTQIGQDEYLIDMVLGGPVLNPNELNITLGNLCTKITVPNFVPVIPPPDPPPSLPPPTPSPPMTILEENEQVISTTQSVFTGLIGASFIGTLALGATAALWSILSLQQFLGYFIYINVNYPSHVELLLAMLDTSIWSLFPNPLASLTESLAEGIFIQNNLKINEALPKKFVKYEVSLFFIENGGTIISINTILLLTVGLVLYLNKIKRLKSNLLLIKLKITLKWNMIARTFLENGMPLSLAIFLQLRFLTLKNGAYLGISSLMAIVSLFYTFLMSSFLLRILFKRNINTLKSKSIIKIYGTLYEGLQLKTSETKYYYLMILWRGILISLLVSFFEATPFIQIIPLVLYNIHFVYYLFQHVSFEQKAQNIIIRIKEILILSGEFCIFFLMLTTRHEYWNSLIGWIMIVVLGAAIAIESCYLLILQILGFKQIIRKILHTFQIGKLYLLHIFKEKPRVKKVKFRRNVLNPDPEVLDISA